MARLLALGLALALSACSLIMPAAWRSFRADPDDAAPAITQAVEKRQLQVDVLDEGQRKISTGWATLSSGVDRTRERFVITWNRDEGEGSLVIYVRHEAQDQEIGERHEWGATYHDGKKETALLDAITEELAARKKGLE